VHAGRPVVGPRSARWHGCHQRVTVTVDTEERPGPRSRPDRVFLEPSESCPGVIMHGHVGGHWPTRQLEAVLGPGPLQDREWPWQPQAGTVTVTIIMMIFRVTDSDSDSECCQSDDVGVGEMPVSPSTVTVASDRWTISGSQTGRPGPGLRVGCSKLEVRLGVMQSRLPNSFLRISFVPVAWPSHGAIQAAWLRPGLGHRPVTGRPGKIITAECHVPGINHLQGFKPR
jgi:hypothetical protein